MPGEDLRLLHTGPQRILAQDFDGFDSERLVVEVLNSPALVAATRRDADRLRAATTPTPPIWHGDRPCARDWCGAGEETPAPYHQHPYDTTPRPEDPLLLTTTAPTLLKALTERTLVLATVGEDIPRATAGELTGLKPRRLGALIDEGTLHPSTRRAHLLTRSLVNYLVRTNNGLVTLFDFLHHQTEQAGAASRLQGNEISAARGRITKAPDQHGLPRALLRLTSMPPITPAWEKWYRGEQGQALADMHTWHQRLRDRERRVAQHAPHGANRTRVVWVAPTTPTPYTLYLREQLAYRVNAGQEVRVTNCENVTPLEHTGPLPEVEVYVSGVILVHHHTMLGAPAGTTHLADPELARGLIAVIDLLASTGRPLHDHTFRLTGRVR